MDENGNLIITCNDNGNDPNPRGCGGCSFACSQIVHTFDEHSIPTTKGIYYIVVTSNICRSSEGDVTEGNYELHNEYVKKNHKNRILRDFHIRKEKGDKEKNKNPFITPLFPVNKFYNLYSDCDFVDKST